MDEKRKLHHLRCTLWLSLIFAFQPASWASTPNIVFILTDDQRFDMLSSYETFPWLKTPNLDRLAKEGAHFKNAFVTTSVCGPSRASFLTGTYAHRHGVIVNAYKDPDPKTPMFPALLNKAGYHTGFIGKWHLAEETTPRDGFDYWAVFPGQGKYFENTFNVNGELTNTEKYVTDEITDRAINFIQRSHQKPFMLYLSHKAIHHPYAPAPRHSTQYKNQEIPEIDSSKEDMSTKPQWLRNAVEDMRKNPKISAEQRMDMLRAISAVDESVGRIRDELDRLDILESTVIIFAGDNGYFFGEHGITVDKRKAYEPSIRIPLLIRYPSAIKGETQVTAMALNIDIAPTILELAGVEIPTSVQGRSLLSLFRGNGDWRNSFLYEYYSENDYRPRGGSTSTPTTLALRTENWKYITYPEIQNETVELYNLNEDPHELHNLAEVNSYSGELEHMQNLFKDYMQEIDYAEPELTTFEKFCINFRSVCRGINYIERRIYSQ